MAGWSGARQENILRNQGEQGLRLCHQPSPGGGLPNSNALPTASPHALSLLELRLYATGLSR